MAWTDDRVEKLKKLWEEGRSASEIAKELGEVTRNAVIGKVHRMGLASRTADASANSKTTKPAAAAKEEPVKAATAKAAPKAPAEPVAEPVETVAEEPRVPVRNDAISAEALETAKKVENEAKKLSLMQLTERTCKWPIGDPSTDNFWFCGHASQLGKPYCEAHVELAFQAPMSRRDRR